MSSSSHSPRRSLPRYKNIRQAPIKKQEKRTLTHQEFLSIIEPFYEPLKKKHFEELKKMSDLKNFDFKKEMYLKWATHLNEKLMSSYQFEDDVEVEEFQFDTPLELRKPIKSQDVLPSFYEKNRVLEAYRTSVFKSLLAEYKSQVERNNGRRSLILDVLPKRIRFSAYFRIFDLINGKLEEIYKKKANLKKKTTLNELNYAMIREYLDRMNEFFEVFGPPDQFVSDEMNHPDIIEDVLDKEIEPNLQYFK